MIVTDGTGCARFTFRNDVRNKLRFGQFQALADYLIGSGFTTERVSDSIAYGPSIATRRTPLNASDTAKMVEAYSKASSAGLDIRADRGEYRLVRRQPRPNEGVMDWLLTCPEKDFFIPIPSESTDTL